MAKFKKVVNYTREDAWFKQKVWITPKLLFLAVLGVAGQTELLALVAFFVLGIYWTVKLIAGLLSGKYTGIR